MAQAEPMRPRPLFSFEIAERKLSSSNTRTRTSKLGGNGRVGFFRLLPENLLAVFLPAYLSLKDIAIWSSTCCEFRSSVHSPLPLVLVLEPPSLVQVPGFGDIDQRFWIRLDNLPFAVTNIMAYCERYVDLGLVCFLVARLVSIHIRPI